MENITSNQQGNEPALDTDETHPGLIGNEVTESTATLFRVIKSTEMITDSLPSTDSLYSVPIIRNTEGTRKIRVSAHIKPDQCLCSSTVVAKNISSSFLL